MVSSFLKSSEETPVEINIMNSILCSNINRVGILHLLKKMPKNEMQAEKIAYSLGISHRTTLYHLAILEECGFVEVRKFRKKGPKLLRSVWGLSKKNKLMLGVIFGKISDCFDCDELNVMIKKDIMRR